MRNGVGMWGLQLVLLAILVVLTADTALFPSAGSEVWSEQRAQATLLPGTSDPGGGEPTEGLLSVKQWPVSAMSAVVRASTRWADVGISVARAGDALVRRVNEAIGRGVALVRLEATGAPADGVIVPLWDLLAIGAMVVTFGVLVGSWARRGR
ncbi:MAG: hypothetical protein EPO21_23295 [Chloroflexota bacterium]|nr:MAG: hypothetical protein EPO21_23295 [Chloroflexota bacterium]